MPRVTMNDCDRIVGRLAKILGRELHIEYSGAPCRPTLYLADGRRISPRLRAGEFYKWVRAAIKGIELYTETRG